MSGQFEQQKSGGELDATNLAPPPEPTEGKSAAAQSMDGPNGVKTSGIVESGGDSGVPLPAEIQQKFGKSVGKDLTGVRVHTGAKSATKAREMGARAFTVGNDIHFAEGQYAPETKEGQELLAHEVAHTVQQDGHQPQSKLKSTEAGDAHETEADTAAPAMLQGQTAKVENKSGPAIARKEDKAAGAKDAAKQPAKEDDKTWAMGQRAKIVSLQVAALSAQTVLNEDATTAVAAGKQSQQGYNSFESAYADASKRFIAGVKKAMDQAEQIREGAKMVAAVALAAFGGEAGELISKAGEIGEKIAKAAEVVNSLQEAQAAGEAKASGKGGEEGAKEAKKPGEKPQVAPGKTDATNWNDLLTTTLSAFSRYSKSTSNISSISSQALASSTYLTSVVEGTHVGEARTNAQGLAAAKCADGAEASIKELQSIKAGVVSSAATKFATDVTSTLGKLSSQKIEQDIAIKWLSGLKRDEVDAIGDAGSYLKKIGVIDTKDNYLGVDTGSYTTEWDNVIIRQRAQMDQRCKAMVGGIHKFEYEKLFATNVIGSVHPDGQSSQWWAAIGPATINDKVKEVRVVGYTIGGIDKDVRANWDHINESQLETRMHSNVTLNVEPA